MCHCINKNAIEKEYEIKDKQEAHQKAQEIVEILTHQTCKTHKFTIFEKKDGFLIESKFNEEVF
jgi:hypothetical protein